jgi:hypothetical protein
MSYKIACTVEPAKTSLASITSLEHPARHRQIIHVAMKTHPGQRQPDKLPDPWLFDSEALLRELDRCRETVLQIPITNPNATHFGIQLAVNAIYNLGENLRYLLHLHREQQRSIRRQHEQTLAQALSAQPNAKQNIVHLHREPTPAPSNGTRRTPPSRERFAKRRRAQIICSLTNSATAKT